MKKIVSILLTAVLCLTAFSFTAFAEEAEEMVPVVAQVPEGWEAPCLWAWADDGTNAFAAWPGEEMEALGDNWYFCYVPGFVQNVIVNATGATVQTDGIVVEAGKPVWITIAEDKTATVSYEAATTAEIPEYVEKFVVHAYVPLEWKTVNMYSEQDGTNALAEWPGVSLKEGEDGWFTGKAPAGVNSLIINGNDGAVQTEDITVEGKELWVTVYEDLTYELSYEDPNKTAEDITVRVKVPDDWAAPCCWAWSAPDGTNAFTAWPGEAFTLDGDWYTITAPGWINSVIINGNEGAVQTTDLSVDPGKDIWVVIQDADNAVVTYEEPAGEATLPETTEPETAAPTIAEEPVTEATAEESSNGNNTGVIIGIVAAVAVVGGGAVAYGKKK